jgi:hypothetical protein
VAVADAAQDRKSGKGGKSTRLAARKDEEETASR